MRVARVIRFSMSTIMMFVLTVAAGMALFVKISEHTDGALPKGWNFDVPCLFLLAIVLTAVALGSWKEHTAVQIMLQVTIACFSCLTLIWIGEAQYERAIRYWCQAAFAVTVTLPMLARRFIKSSMPRGPRRDWWKKTCEAAFFSFLTMLLVSAGGAIQILLSEAAPAFATPNSSPAPPLPAAVSSVATPPGAVQPPFEPAVLPPAPAVGPDFSPPTKPAEPDPTVPVPFAPTLGPKDGSA
jgi:hypothetical protein